MSMFINYSCKTNASKNNKLGNDFWMHLPTPKPWAIHTSAQKMKRVIDLMIMSLYRCIRETAVSHESPSQIFAPGCKYWKIRSKEQMEKKKEKREFRPVWHCVQTPHTADIDPAFSSSWSRSAGHDSLFATAHSGYLHIIKTHVNILNHDFDSHHNLHK